jgi:D-amino peptidase
MRRLLFALALAACAPAEAPEATGTTAAAPAEPWTLADVVPDTTDGLRILVLHDMEGLSGQSDPKTFNFGEKEYPKGQEMLAADVNAVIEGLYAGGATEVWVVDGHGSGNPDPDVRADLLDKRARQILRDSTFDAYFDLVTPKAFDGVAVVGMHAKTGSRGFASHTFTVGIGLAVNGTMITETELVGLSWGRQGIPVIFGSGDDRLAADLATMPWIEFVTVKKATAADSAEPRPIAEARADLTAKARVAVENLKAGRARAMKVSLPMTAGLRAVYPASLAMLDGIPGIDYRDSMVTFPADSMRHAYDVMIKLVGVATTGYARLLQRAVASNPAAPAVMKQFGANLEQAWYDYESGRWQPPARREPPAGKKYHGYQ